MIKKLESIKNINTSKVIKNFLIDISFLTDLKCNSLKIIFLEFSFYSKFFFEEYDNINRV